MTQTPWTPQHIDYVAEADLPRRRGGYLADDVDRQLRRVVACMRAGQAAPSVVPTGLRRTRVREGYVPEQVDSVLGQVASWQREFDVIARQLAPTPEPELRAEESPAEKLKWTRQQQEWVRESTFTRHSGSRAYDVDDVDDFLDQVLITMAKGLPLPDVASVRFYPPRFGRSGYDAVMVDQFLDQLAMLTPAL